MMCGIKNNLLLTAVATLVLLFHSHLFLQPPAMADYVDPSKGKKPIFQICWVQCVEYVFLPDGSLEINVWTEQGYKWRCDSGNQSCYETACLASCSY